MFHSQRFRATSRAAFQVEDLIFPHRLCVHFAEYVHSRVNSLPLVHCGIMRSDFLHVQSYRFEGLGDFVFFCCAQHVLSPRRRRGGKKRFISCCASGVSFYTLIHHKIIQHKVPIVRALGLVETHLPPAVPARFTSPITHLNRKYS